MFLYKIIPCNNKYNVIILCAIKRILIYTKKMLNHLFHIILGVSRHRDSIEKDVPDGFYMKLTFLIKIEIKSNDNFFNCNHSLCVKDVHGCATGDVDQLLRGKSGDYLLFSRLLRHKLMLHINIFLWADVSKGQGFVP